MYNIYIYWDIQFFYSAVHIKQRKSIHSTIYSEPKYSVQSAPIFSVQYCTKIQCTMYQYTVYSTVPIYSVYSVPIYRVYSVPIYSVQCTNIHCTVHQYTVYSALIYSVTLHPYTVYRAPIYSVTTPIYSVHCGII